LTPTDITTKTVEDLLLPDVGVAVVTIRLVTNDGRPELSAWVRYHSDSRLRRNVSSGLNRLTGRQLAAVRASLPAPVARPLLVLPSRPLLDDDDVVLSVGQLQESAARVPAAQ
jgi:hypothetical protein